MRQNPSFTLADPEEIKRLVRENPWATIVSNTSNGLVASHYPVLVDETREELSLVTHFGKPDELLHELGEHEILFIVQGPHGYISPGWYGPRVEAPTWNFIVAHLSGVPEILSEEENIRVLDTLVDHFESRIPEPRSMMATPEAEQYTRRTATGTVGLRLTPTKLVAKSKLSQNKPVETVNRIVAELEGFGPYANPGLAAEMRRAQARLKR